MKKGSRSRAMTAFRSLIRSAARGATLRKRAPRAATKTGQIAAFNYCFQIYTVKLLQNLKQKFVLAIFSPKSEQRRNTATSTTSVATVQGVIVASRVPRICCFSINSGTFRNISCCFATFFEFFWRLSRPPVRPPLPSWRAARAPAASRFLKNSPKFKNIFNLQC